jgi:hypothetical protein
LPEGTGYGEADHVPTQFGAAPSPTKLVALLLLAVLVEPCVLLVLAVLLVLDVALLLALPASCAGPDEFVPQATARISSEMFKAAGKRIRMRSSSRVPWRTRLRRTMKSGVPELATAIVRRDYHTVEVVAPDSPACPFGPAPARTDAPRARLETEARDERVLEGACRAAGE